ncbi:MAG TPA: hypothetical protein VMF68_13675, partial [Spirochaetia bacterium]|nr:hypothetical protein [Spirochaetia bacterium]
RGGDASIHTRRSPVRCNPLQENRHMAHGARFELPVESFIKLGEVFDALEHAATAKDLQRVRDLAKAGWAQLMTAVAILE